MQRTPRLASKRSLPPTPTTPTPLSKRAKPSSSQIAPAISSSPSDSALLASEISLSNSLAEREGILLHPSLTFKFADARAHLISVDPRWKALIDALHCRPFNGEQTEEFNPFKSLVTSIIGQQVSWLAARSITHRFVRLFFPHLPEKRLPPGSSAPGASGAEEELPFPTPMQIMSLEDPTTTLRSAGLSGRKVEYVIELASRFVDGRLRAERLWEMGDDEVRKTLLEVRGIGIWTVQMFLIFSMKRPDVLPVGDLGIQKALCKWYSPTSINALSIHPQKLSHNPPQATLPPDSKTVKVEEGPSTPKRKSGKPQESYPTPSTPGVKLELDDVEARLDEGEEEEVVSPYFGGDEETKSTFVFPQTSNGLTPQLMHARLSKKLKGNIYLNPQEMEELTIQWSPFRSVAMWYLWSIADGTGEP